MLITKSNIYAKDRQNIKSLRQNSIKKEPFKEKKIELIGQKTHSFLEEHLSSRSDKGLLGPSTSIYSLISGHSSLDLNTFHCQQKQ